MYVSLQNVHLSYHRHICRCWSNQGLSRKQAQRGEQSACNEGLIYRVSRVQRADKAQPQSSSQLGSVSMLEGQEEAVKSQNPKEPEPRASTARQKLCVVDT